MAVTPRDKALLGAALLVAIGSAVTFAVFMMRSPSAPSGPVPRVELASVAYVPNAPEAPPIKTETWGPPGAQTRGRDWIYDTFTPPEIFYNARSKQFTVKPPSSLVDDDQLEAFGLDLIAVRPEAFRLQLIGYVGTVGNWKGMFQNVTTGQTLVGTVGLRIPNLGLSIKGFDVTPQPIRTGDTMSVKQRVATAVVHDEKSGRDVTITHRERVFTGTLFAFVAATGETAVREVRVGDAFKLGEATYRIENIAATPPTVDVTKESPALSQPDRRVLTPREAEDVERPDGG